MFGGLAFLIHGNMSVAASGQGGLLLRVALEETQALAGKPHARPMVMRGQPLRGWLRVDAEGLVTKRQLERWVKQFGVTHAELASMYPHWGDFQAARAKADPTGMLGNSYIDRVLGPSSLEGRV